jgi:hypothetical protein
MKKFLLLLLSFYAINSVAQGGLTCAAATTLTTNGTYTIGSLTTGTAPTGAGLCFTTASTTPNARWFKFIPTSNGVMTINSDIAVNGTGATVDTRLSVLTGACAAPWTCIAANDDVDEAGGNYRSILTDVVVTSGTTYYIVWDDRWNSADRSFDFTFTGQTCFAPSGFVFTAAPTTTTAGIGWTAPTVGTPAGYQFEYGVRGFVQGSPNGTLITNSTPTPTNVSLTSLSPSTVYEFYVRTFCGGTDYSNWVGPITFSTVFLPSNVPYTTSFEDTLVDYIGWDAPTPATGAGQAWEIINSTVGNALVQDGASSVAGIAGSTAATNINLISRGLNLQGSQQVTITLWARNFVSPATLTNTSTIELYYGDQPLVASQTNLIGTQAGIASTTYTQYTFTFTPPATGVYYISVRNVSAPINSTTDFSAVIMDNFSVTQTLSVNDFLSTKFSVFPNPTNNIINFSNDQNAVVSTIELADLNGRVVKTLKVNATEGQVSVSDLATGMYMMKITTDQGVAVKKIVKQ